MSTPTHDVIFSLIIEMRSFQVRASQDEPDLWRATISERTGGLHHTQKLGAVESTTGVEVALYRAFRYILQQTGVVSAHESRLEPRTVPASKHAATPWRLLG